MWAFRGGASRKPSGFRPPAAGARDSGYHPPGGDRPSLWIGTGVHPRGRRGIAHRTFGGSDTDRRGIAHPRLPHLVVFYGRFGPVEPLNSTNLFHNIISNSAAGPPPGHPGPKGGPDARLLRAYGARGNAHRPLSPDRPLDFSGIASPAREMGRWVDALAVALAPAWLGAPDPGCGLDARARTGPADQSLAERTAGNLDPQRPTRWARAAHCPPDPPAGPSLPPPGPCPSACAPAS
jgi:hypothetical protein